MPARPDHHPPRPAPWQRRGVRLVVALMLVALGMGLAFDAGRQSARRGSTAQTASPPAVAAMQPAVPSRVADTTPPEPGALRHGAPALPAVPLGRRVPVENACGACHRIADPEIPLRARPMM